MRILALEHDLPAPVHPHLRQLLRDEAACLWSLAKRDVVRDAWFTTDRHRAVLMLECASAAEARQQLGTLPLVKSGLIEFTLHELHPYDGFERLFAPSTTPPAPKPAEPPDY